MREFESRAASERQTLEIELRSIVAQRDELEGKLVLLGTEIDRLQGLLTQMARERDDLRMREHDLQLEIDRVKISVETQIRQTIVLLLNDSQRLTSSHRKRRLLKSV